MIPLPPTMRAVQLRAYDGAPESVGVVEMPVPRPGPGQVLVRVYASPVHPSDYFFLHGFYSFKKPLPAVPGFEGTGTVVEAGAGLLPRLLKGKRVACSAAAAGIAGGMWAEYVATSAQLCVPLRKSVTLEQGATMLVNPLTAWALMEEARRGGHRAVVQPGAASALGRRIGGLGQRDSISGLSAARRSER